MGIKASNNPTQCEPIVLTRYLGEFETLSALTTAHPTAAAGSYALVGSAIYFYSVTNSEWFTIESQSTSSQIITTGQIVNDGIGGISVLAGTQAIINGVLTPVASQYDFIVPLTSEGFSRIDVIVINTSGVLSRIQGVESDTAAAAPAISNNTLIVTYINVNNIGTGTITTTQSPIQFGDLRLKAKGDGNVDPQLEIGDIVEGFKDATTYWSAAVYNGGDATDRANYTPLVETSLT